MEKYISGKVYEAVTFYRADSFAYPVMWTGETKMYNTFVILETKVVDERNDVYGSEKKEMLVDRKVSETLQISKKTCRQRGRNWKRWNIEKTPIDKPEEHVFISTSYND
jgi:hypothetical protein